MSATPNRITCPNCETSVTSLALVCPQCKQELVRGGKTKLTPDRPYSIWYFSAYFLIFGGILPLYAIYRVYQNPFLRDLAGIGSVLLIVNILIAGGTAIAAIGLWMGSNTARIAILAFAALALVLSGLQILVAILGPSRLFTTGIREILNAILAFWYLRRIDAIRYTNWGKQVEQKEKADVI